MATGLAPAAVGCPHCGRPLDLDQISPGRQLCPRCRRDFEAVVFTPPERRVRVAEVAGAGPEGGTSCAVHKRNAAVANCGRCGIFLCAVCRVDVDRKVLCPACFDRLTAEGTLSTVRTRFRDYAGIAATCAALGIGPVAVYYAFRGLKQRDERGDAGGRAGLYITITLGVLESIGAVALFVALLR